MSSLGKNHRIRVLVCLEFLSYSEAIGTVIEALRSELLVQTSELRRLCEEIESFVPDVVLCGRPRCPVPERAAREKYNPFWIEFYPYASPEDQLIVNGVRAEAEEVDLEYLLSVLDELVLEPPNPR